MITLFIYICMYTSYIYNIPYMCIRRIFLLCMCIYTHLVVLFLWRALIRCSNQKSNTTPSYSLLPQWQRPVLWAQGGNWHVCKSVESTYPLWSPSLETAARGGGVLRTLTTFTRTLWFPHPPAPTASLVKGLQRLANQTSLPATKTGSGLGPWPRQAN